MQVKEIHFVKHIFLNDGKRFVDVVIPLTFKTQLGASQKCLLCVKLKPKPFSFS